MATVLVVEDDEDTRDLLTEYLERCGHQAVPAANGWEALLAVDRRPFDLILLDVMMPGMDGPSFLKILRMSRHQKETPVVVVSALDPDRLESRLEPLKVAAILPKRDDLLVNVRDAVARHVRTGEHMPDENVADGHPPTTSYN